MSDQTELKVVIHIGSGSHVGVQEKDTDPVVERLEVHSLEEALAAVPGVVQRARERCGRPAAAIPATSGLQLHHPHRGRRPGPPRREEHSPSREGQMQRLI